jgi:hypothetical protein
MLLHTAKWEPILLNEPMMETTTYHGSGVSQELTRKLIEFSERFIIMNFGTFQQRMAFQYPSLRRNGLLKEDSYGSWSPFITTKKSISLTLRDYIWSVVEHMQLNVVQFLLGIYYLYRLKSLNTELEGDIHIVAPRLFLAAMVCSTKFTLDHAYLNRVWAKVCDIYSTSGINQMETEFLKYLGYRLAVNETEFVEFMIQVDLELIGYDSTLCTLRQLSQ